MFSINADEQLFVEKAKNGDEEAFYQLIEMHQEKLYRMAYVYVQNENDAVDIYQQTIIRAFEGIAQLKNNQYFSTWLMRILINCSKSYIAKQKNIEVFEPSYFDEKQMMEHIHLEEQLDLWRAINMLEEKYKTALLLRFYQDYSVNQIAGILDCPEGTVKTNIRRGLRILRKQLKGVYIDEWVQSVEGSYRKDSSAANKIKRSVTH
ncbi:MAG: sigma-70 family RNA polymerase sigma factor [Lysinibacillus sp.]